MNQQMSVNLTLNMEARGMCAVIVIASFTEEAVPVKPIFIEYLSWTGPSALHAVGVISTACF